MQLVKDDSGWHIEGEGSDRAQIAYVSERDGRIFYRQSSSKAGLGRSSV
jgi:hypothetical protein